jgi:hypothetical protein
VQNAYQLRGFFIWRGAAIRSSLPLPFHPVSSRRSAWLGIGSFVSSGIGIIQIAPKVIQNHMFYRFSRFYFLYPTHKKSGLNGCRLQGRQNATVGWPGTTTREEPWDAVCEVLCLADRSAWKPSLCMSDTGGCKGIGRSKCFAIALSVRLSKDMRCCV